MHLSDWEVQAREGQEKGKQIEEKFATKCASLGVRIYQNSEN